MFIALNPSEYIDTKYSPKDMSDVKKYEDTPMLVKIKSLRGVKFAKELIDALCSKLGIEKAPIALDADSEIAVTENNEFNFNNFVSNC